MWLSANEKVFQMHVREDPYGNVPFSWSGRKLEMTLDFIKLGVEGSSVFSFPCMIA